MKSILLAFAFGFIGGAALLYSQTAQHYEAKARKEQDAYSKTLAEVAKRSVHYQVISEEYYADYQDAINRESTVVSERLLVRADCKADAAIDSSGKLGNGATEGRAELHPETVRGATTVTDQAERDVLTCRAALHSLQRKIQAHNELQREGAQL